MVGGPKGAGEAHSPEAKKRKQATGEERRRDMTGTKRKFLELASVGGTAAAQLRFLQLLFWSGVSVEKIVGGRTGMGEMAQP